MSEKNYSAGMVKLSFWFLEFKKMIKLLNEDKSFSDIKKLNQQKNIFSASSDLRANQIFTTLSKRVKSLDESVYHLFEKLDVSNQKLIVLISIMASDDLFFAFMHEVFREKIIYDTEELADRDFNIFFKDKQLQSERVAGWQDDTIKRLAASYKTILIEAGLLDLFESEDNGSENQMRKHTDRRILRPILDLNLEQYLKDHDMQIMINILTGVS
ncbi:MAG: DUF1819 family protein [Saccharofermentanales bacterium]